MTPTGSNLPNRRDFRCKSASCHCLRRNALAGSIPDGSRKRPAARPFGACNGGVTVAAHRSRRRVDDCGLRAKEKSLQDRFRSANVLRILIPGPSLKTRKVMAHRAVFLDFDLFPFPIGSGERALLKGPRPCRGPRSLSGPGRAPFARRLQTPAGFGSWFLGELSPSPEPVAPRGVLALGEKGGRGSLP